MGGCGDELERWEVGRYGRGKGIGCCSEKEGWVNRAETEGEKGATERERKEEITNLVASVGPARPVRFEELRRLPRSWRWEGAGRDLVESGKTRSALSSATREGRRDQLQQGSTR